MAAPLRVVGGNSVPDEYDPFATENNGYSVDAFYTRSTDGNGVSETKYVKLPPSLLAGIGDLVASRVIPEYRTEADVIRDAVYHRLHHVAMMKRDGKLVRLINRQIMLARASSHLHEMSELETLIEQHSAAMEQAAQTKDAEFLREIIECAEDDLNYLREAHKNRLQRVITDYRARLVTL